VFDGPYLAPEGDVFAVRRTIGTGQQQLVYLQRTNDTWAAPQPLPWPVALVPNTLVSLGTPSALPHRHGGLRLGPSPCP
jgi:hypothetical protein